MHTTYIFYDFQIIVAFADPGTSPSHPGWPLRNILICLSHCWFGNFYFMNFFMWCLVSENSLYSHLLHLKLRITYFCVFFHPLHSFIFSIFTEFCWIAFIRFKDLGGQVKLVCFRDRTKDGMRSISHSLFIHIKLIDLTQQTGKWILQTWIINLQKLRGCFDITHKKYHFFKLFVLSSMHWEYFSIKFIKRVLVKF